MLLLAKVRINRLQISRLSQVMSTRETVSLALMTVMNEIVLRRVIKKLFIYVLLHYLLSLLEILDTIEIE